MKKPEDADKATFKEVLEWMKTHLPYQNDNDMYILERIIDICSDCGYELPMTYDELIERCGDYLGRDELGW